MGRRADYDPKNPRETHIQIRISERDKERVRQLAAQRGLSLSRYILERILPAHTHTREERAQAFDEMILVKMATGLKRQDAIEQAKRELKLT